MEYEVLVEEINPCGGAKHCVKSFWTWRPMTPRAMSGPTPDSPLWMWDTTQTGTW